jgi:DNA-binding IclR family transcriptional regulator
MLRQIRLTRRQATGGLRYRAPALEKGLDILELLAAEPRGLSQTEVARRIGKSASEIFRMLDVLDRRGYVFRAQPGDRYALSNRLFELSHRHPPTKRLLDASLGEMRRLANETRQSCHLSVFHDINVLIVAQIDSPDPMGFAVRMGANVPLVGTTSGLVLLAFQLDEQRDLLLRRLQLVPAFRRERKLFLTRLRIVLRQGYGEFASEAVKGIIDFSFPIFDHTGIAIAALTMPYLTTITRQIGRAEVREALANSSARITSELGGRAPMPTN